MAMQSGLSGLNQLNQYRAAKVLPDHRELGPKPAFLHASASISVSVFAHASSEGIKPEVDPELVDPVLVDPAPEGQPELFPVPPAPLPVGGGM